MWFKMLSCVFICWSRCIIQLKGFQLWQKYRVKQQLQISVKVVIYAVGAATSVTPLSFLHQTVSCGSIQEKSRTKTTLLQCAYLQHVDFSKYCKFHLLFQWCVTFEAAVTCLLGPCALTGPLGWVCQCCIIRCMMRHMNDDNSRRISPSVSFSLSISPSVSFSMEGAVAEPV